MIEGSSVLVYAKSQHSKFACSVPNMYATFLKKGGPAFKGNGGLRFNMQACVLMNGLRFLIGGLCFCMKGDLHFLWSANVSRTRTSIFLKIASVLCIEWPVLSVGSVKQGGDHRFKTCGGPAFHGDGDLSFGQGFKGTSQHWGVYA